MRILYAINSGERGGAEEHTLNLVEGMCGRGHEVYVWCPEGPMVEEFRKAGAFVVTIKIGLDIDPSYILALTKFLREKKIEILHAHELKAVTNAMLAGFLAGTKVRVSHTHTPISEWQVSSIKKLINKPYSVLVNLFATREIALTLSRKRVKIAEGIRESKLEVIPNAIKVKTFTISDEQKESFRAEILQRYDIPQNAYVLGNLGRLSAEKGLPVLIDGFAKFLEYPGIEKDLTYLIIEGKGELHEKLKTQIEEKGLTANVVIPGVRYSDEDKIKLLSTFDVFVFPSLAEGFGIVPIEAMAMGVPVICSDLEVLQEVGGSVVMIFETGNAENLAEKVFNLYSKRDRLDNIKEEGRKRVEQLYMMETFVNNYENLYFELLEARS
ncbi:hypothetical protein A2886_00810 [candidate division WWE3 bacterium RIFCSPHIGHO2_01_FULL_42_13]|uniref:Glycosyltransferase subfamily 4-like N-terminal domain-containing protein n=1 Tax=candidate division WWE3 bacterium RIFCSPHIGHO2_01_FULL_42_13 TaxID=1802617 RepID=A0A1F4UQB1_UNCKA|nr:MAG: hypothetical protein A2886_00810 [candidate division WWE3 bacterium RIFCSPHIGHO2_01_FULL_42_13]